MTNHVNKIDYENFNVSEHVLGTYYDRDGNVVAFFDNVFPKEMIDAVRTYFTHFEGEFGHNEYDPATSETHDNVNWIIQLEVMFSTYVYTEGEVTFKFRVKTR